MLIEAVSLALFLGIPLFAYAGVFSAVAGMFAKQTDVAVANEPDNAQTAILLRPATHIDPNPPRGGGDIIVNDGALVADGGPGASDAMTLRENGQISVYVVREGDSLSQIAEMFDVTPNTILWANDLKSARLIKPGDSLVILPISGVRYVLKKGDTLASIARTYGGNVNDIVAYNGLSSESAVSVGDTVVIPGGSVPMPPTPPKKAASKKNAGTGHALTKGPSGGNSYLVNPVPGAIRTQGIHGYNAVDLAVPTGTPVHAAASGEVVVSKSGGWNGGYGSYIVIKHPNGTQTLYAHLSENGVSAGQTVSQGESIGASGSTGESTGPHVHFEVRGGANPF